MKRFLTAVALSAAMFSAPAVMAETVAPNAAEQAEARATLQTATAVINYGRSKGDALAMVTGVEMMLGAAEGTTIESDGKVMDLTAVLDEAAELGKDDPLVVAKIDELRDAAETKTRGGCYWEYWCDWYGYCEYWYICY
jgi:opacity protein-like surface antigen